MRPPCTRSFRKQIAPLIVPWVEFLSELGSERILTQNPLKYYSFLCKNLKAGLSVSCTTDLTKLWLSPSAKILVLGSSCVLGFEGLLKSHNLLSVCQSGWMKIRKSPLVIHWVHWRPRTRISTLLCRLGLNLHLQCRLGCQLDSKLPDKCNY